MGWQGKILRVNLSKLSAKAEPLNMKWASEYLGQRGLASKYLYEEVDARVDPYSPRNKLIIATGPLTGTMASTGGRWSAITKGALTGTIASSNSGGHFGAELKLAGWDMIVFEGRAPKPVYLLIRDDRCELLPAERFIWGASVWETEDRIRERHGDPAIRVASIGAAGERGVRFACIMNDRDRAAGRSGVGAVMGSKNLKAIAVRGTQGVAVKDPRAFMREVARARRILDPSDSRARLSSGGTMEMLDVTQAYGSLPTRNGRDVQFEGSGNLNADAMRRVRVTDGRANLVGNKACFACSIGCGRMAELDSTHFSIRGKERYRGVIGGLEYESGYALGPLVGVDDLEAATYANALCNEHGMDPISFGGTVAAAMELFDIGALTTRDTGGVELRFGSAEALAWAAEATGTGEGFGRELGLGSLRLCRKYGHPELAMVAKGQEFPGYDGRAMQGMGLAYATSNRGACHLRADPYADDFSRVASKGKAKIVKESQDRNAALDSTGLCSFPKGPWGFGEYVRQVDAACEGEWTLERMMATGERIWNLEKLFNVKAGFTAKDDTLPERILKVPAKSGAGKGRVCELDAMLPEYYELRGWSADGVPERKTLSRLHLA
jgi:aldehyde:ferredoxin oxidoreductase